MKESLEVSISNIVYFIHFIVHVTFYKPKAVQCATSFKILKSEIERSYFSPKILVRGFKPEFHGPHNALRTTRQIFFLMINRPTSNCLN